MSQHTRPREGQVVTVFRNRLCEQAMDAYAAELRWWPRHREAQRHGIDDDHSEYSIAVGTTSYASAFTWSG